MGTKIEALPDGGERRITTYPTRPARRPKNVVLSDGKTIPVRDSWTVSWLILDAEGMGVRSTWLGNIVTTRVGWTAIDPQGRMVTCWHIGTPSGHRTIKTYLRDKLVVHREQRDKEQGRT